MSIKNLEDAVKNSVSGGTHLDYETMLKGVPRESNDDPPTKPENLPSIGVKTGYKTSQGQITYVIGAVCVILSLMGVFKYDQAKVDTYVGMANNLLETLGPILAFVPIIISYINSRGKVQSNAINATAHINTMNVPQIGKLASFSGGELLPPVEGNEGRLMTAHGVAGIPGLGSFKDPKTYEKIAKGVGIFIPQVGSVVNAIEGSDTSHLDEKFKTDVTSALEQVGKNETAFNSRLIEIEKRVGI